ncbi:MAG: Lrp/AsnC family transcriptional regulator [Oscillospiraceae bacterium]
MDKILRLLDSNARLTNKQIAAMTSMSEAEVAAAIEDYEKKGVIRGYKTLIDWDKTDREYVIARIEIKVEPKQSYGFEEIAKTIMAFEEVQTVYLMSGGYDLALTISGKTFKDVAMFVAYKLSPLESVTSTQTSFVLKKYKERGTIMCDEDIDEREVTTF